MGRPSFKRAVAALVGGTAAAQAITVAALPLLTRLYSPSDFELLAVYLAVLGILSSIACLRFEISIPLPESDEHGVELLMASLLSTLLVTSAVVVAALALPNGLLERWGAEKFSPYLWLLPPGVLLAGLYGSAQYWASRKGRFDQIARSRLGQAATGVGTQVAAGLAGWTPGGLLVGHMLYGGAGASGLAILALRRDRTLLQGLSLSGIWDRMVEYKRFPVYSTFEALANSAAIQLPMLLIATLAIGPEAGFVLLATRVMGAPMQLVGRAVSQVYLTRAPEEMRAGHLGGFTLDIVIRLALLGIPGMVLIALAAPSGFRFVFGDEWYRAGILLQWMTPWFILQFLSSPVSMILHVTGRQRTAMALQVAGLMVRTGMVVAAGWLMPNWIAEAYATSGALFYGMYLMIVLYAARSAPAPYRAQ